MFFAKPLQRSNLCASHRQRRWLTHGELLEYERPTKEELKGLLGRACFYADHNLDESIVYVLRHQKYDVVTAREIGAEQQPDEYHFKWSAQKGRVLLTQDKDFLDNGRFSSCPDTRCRRVQCGQREHLRTGSCSGSGRRNLGRLEANSAPSESLFELGLYAEHSLASVQWVRFLRRKNSVQTRQERT